MRARIIVISLVVIGLIGAFLLYDKSNNKKESVAENVCGTQEVNNTCGQESAKADEAAQKKELLKQQWDQQKQKSKKAKKVVKPKCDRLNGVCYEYEAVKHNISHPYKEDLSGDDIEILLPDPSAKPSAKRYYSDIPEEISVELEEASNI